jgi:hypothetical protein
VNMQLPLYDFTVFLFLLLNLWIFSMYIYLKLWALISPAITMWIKFLSEKSYIFKYVHGAPDIYS